MLIRNARIVVGPDIVRGDLLVEGETIARIDADIPAGSAEVVDAGGKYLLPGGVDVHTHFDLDLGTVRATDSFYTGTVAAACGGTTTIVDHMGFGPQGCRLGHQVGVYHGLAKDAVVDYSFHGVFQHVDDQVLEDMATLAEEEGITSYKVYLTYGGKLGDADVLRVMARAKELGIVICVHCENDASIAFLTKRLLAAGKTAPCSHPRSRPDGCEAEAVYRVIRLAEIAGGTAVYIVHLSTALGLAAIREARMSGRGTVFAETCPQYLFLEETRYDGPEGLKYIMAPPLRTTADQQLLWEGLRRGDIDTVATDHCPFNFGKEKQAGLGDFSHCPGGAPGVEARMALMFSEGFMRGRLTLPEVVRICSTRPARIFGLAPKKGMLTPGADADMVLFDPDVEWTLTHARLHERVDYTPYEGMRLRGAPVLTISRGEVVARNGQFLGKAGRGRFLKRGRMSV